MKNSTDELRRKIALYREYLSQGVSAELASLYLRGILEAEDELRKLESIEKRADSNESSQAETECRAVSASPQKHDSQNH